MKQLVCNELRLWFSKKNIALLFLAVLASYVVFLTYEKPYQEYPQEIIALMENEYTVSQNFVNDYKSQIERIKKETPDDPSLNILSTLMDIWQQENSYASLMKTMFTNNKDHQYDEAILKLDRDMDNNAKRFVELGIKPEVDNIYRYSYEDLVERDMLRTVYQEHDLTQKVNPYLPDGTYVLHDALSGSGLGMMVVFGILVLLNFNCWSYDFETQAYRLLFTQPYSKCKLYTTRCFLTILVNLLVVVGFFFLLFCFASMKYGVGGNDVAAIHPDVLTSTFLISGDGNTSYHLIGSLLMFQMIQVGFYLITFLIGIQTVSLLSKKSELSFMICCAFLLLIFSCIQATPLPILGYFKTMDLLQGSFHITLLTSMSVLSFIAVGFYLFGLWYLKKRDCL